MSNSTEFETALKTWIEGATKIYNDHMAQVFPTLPLESLELRKGRKYVKVVKGGSAFAFIDITNGNVLKPANWKSPAKKVRGNIFDSKNGLGTMSAYGPAYLR